MILSFAYNFVLLFVFIKSTVLAVKYPLRKQNYLFMYLLVSSITEFVSLAIFYIDPEINVGLLYNIYVCFCIIFFFVFYSRILRKVLKTVSLTAFVMTISYLVIFTKIWESVFDYRVLIAATLFSILNTLLWFYQKINSNDMEKITEDPSFWISSALLLWSVFSIFRIIPMFLFSSTDEGFHEILRMVMYIVNIIMYSMFYVALLKYKK